MWSIERERERHLSFRPIVLLKNVVIHFSGAVGHKHYGLAAHAATSSSIKLHRDKKHMNMYHRKKIRSEMLFKH